MNFDMLPDWRVPMLPGRIPSRTWWFRRMSSSTDSHIALPRFANRPPVYQKDMRREDKWCKKWNLQSYPIWRICRVNQAKTSRFVMSKMVFCYQNCSELLREKIVLWLRKTLEIRGWRPRICKLFVITRTIYSNSERSEQFVVTECFFNVFL